MSKTEIEQAAKKHIGLPSHKDMDEEEKYYNPKVGEYNAFIAGAEFVTQNLTKTSDKQISVSKTSDKDKIQDKTFTFKDLCVLTTFIRDNNHRLEGKGIINTEVIKQALDIDYAEQLDWEASFLKNKLKQADGQSEKLAIGFSEWLRDNGWKNYKGKLVNSKELFQEYLTALKRII